VNTWARVIEHEELGEKLYRLRLRAPQIAAEAKPGQFVMLKVRHGKDPLLARPFSIHGVEGDDIFILYRVVGRGTSILFLTRTGKSLAVWGPLGSGFDLNVENPILVAGGMGRAPLAFAARVLEDRGKEVQWVHGGPNAAEINYLVAELTARLSQAPRQSGLEGFRRFMAYKSGKLNAAPKEFAGTSVYTSTEDGSEGHKGLVTSLLSDLLPEASSSIPVSLIACGPMPMLKAVAKVAAKHGTPCQVSLEAPMACGIGVCLGCVIPQAGGGYLRACQEGPVLNAMRVDWGRV
jgi:dihydroorotate dehydrogenase electron transfer subunit